MSDRKHPVGETGLALRDAPRGAWLSRLGIPSFGRLVYLGELTRELVVRDLKLRYKRTILGVAWSLVSPLSQWLVLGFVFRYIFNIQIDSYLSFLFTGILVWNWLQSSLLACATCVVDNATLLRRPGFPAPILPLVAVTTQWVQFLFAVPILLVAASFDGEPWTPALFALPLLMLLQFVFTLGIGYFVAMLHVVYRDTRHLLDVALMLAFYLTPVFYDGRTVPEPFVRAFRLNPMLHFLEAYRDVAVLGAWPDPATIGRLAIWALLAGALGYWSFRRKRHEFVEEL